MIILDDTTKSVEIALDSAVDGNELEWVSSAIDFASGSYAPLSDHGVTNGTTAVTVMESPAASTKRQVKYFSLFNRDSATRTVTVSYNDNGTIRKVVSVILAVGYTLQYNDGNGWSVLAGSAIVSPAVTPTAWWKLDETSGSRIDEVNGIELEVNATVASDPGLIGNCAEFAASTNGSLRMGTAVSGGSTLLPYTEGDDFSFAIWRKFTVAISGNGILKMSISFRDVSNNELAIILSEDYGDNDMAVWIADDGVGYDEIVQTMTPTAGQWYLWVVTYDGATGLVEWSIDGTVIGTTASPVTIQSAVKSRIELRKHVDPHDAHMLDEFGVWMNHKLTADEITALFNAQAGVTYPW